MNTYFRCLESRIDKNNTLYGKFSLNSILSGQGNTFANSLRRSLFSDLSGLAITHFCITSKPGLSYEFATLPGLTESILDFSLNLKKVVLTGRVIDYEIQNTIYDVPKSSYATTTTYLRSTERRQSLPRQRRREARSLRKASFYVPNKSTYYDVPSSRSSNEVASLLRQRQSLPRRLATRPKVDVEARPNLSFYVPNEVAPLLRQTRGNSRSKTTLVTTINALAPLSSIVAKHRRSREALSSIRSEASQISSSCSQKAKHKISTALPIAPIGFLKAKGPTVLRAKDLILPPGIRCVHPNQYLGTLAADGALSIKFLVAAGKGFVVQDEPLYNSLSRAKLLLKSNILSQVHSKHSKLSGETRYYVPKEVTSLKEVPFGYATSFDRRRFTAPSTTERCSRRGRQSLSEARRASNLRSSYAQHRIEDSARQSLSETRIEDRASTSYAPNVIASLLRQSFDRRLVPSRLLLRAKLVGGEPVGGKAYLVGANFNQLIKGSSQGSIEDRGARRLIEDEAFFLRACFSLQTEKKLIEGKNNFVFSLNLPLLLRSVLLLPLSFGQAVNKVGICLRSSIVAKFVMRTKTNSTSFPSAKQARRRKALSPITEHHNSHSNKRALRLSTITTTTTNLRSSYATEGRTNFARSRREALSSIRSEDSRPGKAYLIGACFTEGKLVENSLKPTTIFYATSFYLLPSVAKLVYGRLTSFYVPSRNAASSSESIFDRSSSFALQHRNRNITKLLATLSPTIRNQKFKKIYYQAKQSISETQNFLLLNKNISGSFSNTYLDKSNSSKKLLKKQFIWNAEEDLYPVLPLDVTFTPVSKVNFQINVNRNSEKNEETIIFEIWTNGSITPKRAIQESCLSLAQDFYNIFCHVNEFSSLQFWWKRESTESKITLGGGTPRSKLAPMSYHDYDDVPNVSNEVASLRRNLSQSSFAPTSSYYLPSVYGTSAKPTSSSFAQALPTWSSYARRASMEHRIEDRASHVVVEVPPSIQHHGTNEVASLRRNRRQLNNKQVESSIKDKTTNKTVHSQVKNSTKVQFSESKNLKLKQKVHYLHAFWRLNVSDLNLSLETQLILKKLSINSVYDLHFFILRKSWSLFLNRQHQNEIIKIYLNFGLNSPF